MKRKLLGLTMALVAALPVFVNAEGNAVKIGEKEYATLKDAVEAVEVCTEETCETTTISVVANHETSGIKFASGKYLEIDLGGFTVTFKEQTVGSKGTETNDMQILKDSTITFKNGKLVSSNTEKSKYFIQNYANLTLKDVEIDATNELNQNALSINNGVVSIEGTTSIKATKIAFDVYGWYGSYSSGPQVTVNTTGTIEGDIEVATDGKPATKELSLVIKNIDHVGTMTIKDSLQDNVTIEAGSYTDAVAAEKLPVAEGSEVYEVGVTDGSVKYVVATEEELEEGYLWFLFENETVEDIYGEEVLTLIKEALSEKYNAASYYELFYGDLLGDGIVLDSIKSELEEAVKVTLEIPTNLEKVKEGYTRKYVAIRIHENQAGEYETTVLEAKDNQDGTVTFETDKFSTYVLAYEDVKTETSSTSNPDTLDGISLYMIIAAASLVGLGSLVVYTKKAKNY